MCFDVSTGIAVSIVCALGLGGHESLLWKVRIASGGMHVRKKLSTWCWYRTVTTQPEQGKTMIFVDVGVGLIG
jgi:hypothetical protein